MSARISVPAWTSAVPPGGGFGMRSNGNGFGVRTSVCAPVQCCCKGPWSIAPGESQPLTLDWSRWLNSAGMGGFTLAGVASCELIDLTVNPPEAANPDDIQIVSGLPNDTTAGDNADATGLVNLMPQYNATQIFIEVAPDARIGSQYRLNICVTARDCDGRRARTCDCVTILVAEC